MPRHVSPEPKLADDPAVGAQRRCLYCNGISVGLAEQDLGIGLNIKVGLVSDECTLIRNECTMKLTVLREPSVRPLVQRR